VRVALEIAVATPDEAVLATRSGADRLELSAGLELGGLTPSLGVFRQVKKLVAVPIWVLLRPRAGGFIYDEHEAESILSDAETFLAAGADGLVFGALNAAGEVEETSCRRLAALAPGRATFHRAFDFTSDPLDALERLIALGFRRVLTSGGATAAHDGARRIAELIARARGRIEILPGAGIRADNVTDIVRITGCNQVHAAARSVQADPCFARNPMLATAMGAKCANLVSTTDANLVAALRSELDRPTSLT
jgi:copper homeostasis protein CutC